MHLQRQGDEHFAFGNGGASSLKKRLSRSASAAGHAAGPATTLTACQRCLKESRLVRLRHDLQTSRCGSPPQPFEPPSARKSRPVPSRSAKLSR